MGRRVFISCVTDEFGDLRKKLRHYLTAADCEVKTQEDFRQDDVDILEKLDDYIKKCDAVIHIVGRQPGSKANSEARQRYLDAIGEFLPAKPELRKGLGDCSDLTYTQWEAFMTIHRGARLRVYHYPGAQPKHLARLKLGLPQRYGTEIDDEIDIVGKLIGDLRNIIPQLPERKPKNLPGSIGSLFKGREIFLDRIRTALIQKSGAAAVTAAQAIYGLGGIGKTRAAIEYGYRYQDEYTALLFLRADSEENLRRNLANLTGPMVLDLPEYSATDDEIRVAATLRWLDQHPGWFLIFDNVDTPEVAQAVEDLLGRLSRVTSSSPRDWTAGALRWRNLISMCSRKATLSSC